MKKGEKKTFETVRVKRINDGKVMEMSAKVFNNVHKGGEIFELADRKEKANG